MNRKTLTKPIKCAMFMMLVVSGFFILADIGRQALGIEIISILPTQGEPSFL